MDNTYWHKQIAGKPLFPDLIWSRPENRNYAGKLLIIGGNSHGFAAPAQAFIESEKTGIGSLRVLLPDALQKSLSSQIENAYFLPSTPSGSFSQQALGEILDHTAWADGTLLAGDFGKNSETTILLEKYVKENTKPLILTQDAVDNFVNNPSLLQASGNLCLVANIRQLQKIVTSLHIDKTVTSDMDVMRLAEVLHHISNNFNPVIVAIHSNYIFVALRGRISTTIMANTKQASEVQVAAYASVWYIQNPSKPFEAITTSLIDN